jgi:phospholipid/cholesterol/gamma-HCH transport system substrate-binding protein
VTDVYLPNIRQVLVIGPAAANDLASAIMTDPVPGSSNVDFRFEANNPAPCEQGYNSSMRDPSETGTTASPATAPHCTASHSSPQDVRGARNNPCPNNPSVESSTAAGCGLYFGSAADSGSGSGGSGSGGSVGATPYDPTNGLFVGPNDILYSAGAGTITGNGPNTLSQLLQQTLGS